MNTLRDLLRKSRYGLLGCVVVASCLAQTADADTILLAQTTLVSGTQSTTDSFVAPSDGTVTVQLSNLDWPERLSSLSFAASTATHVMSAWSWSALSADAESFEVGAGTYFAHVTSQATGALNLGLYSLRITFSPSAPPVPLPPSDWMLVAGVLALAALARMMGVLKPLGAPER
jgi:hypothetical protein